MKDWLIITRFGPTRLFVIRGCTREKAIAHVENEADFEYEPDMDNDYVEVHEIPGGECVEVEVELD